MPRKVKYIVGEHFATGAKVPIRIKKIKDNVIMDYEEVTEGRKGFTLLMLQERWSKNRDEVLEILQHHKVPAHVDHREVIKAMESNPRKDAIDVAIFFEEYIHGIEKMLQLAHKKLKSKKLYFKDEH